MQQTHGLFTFSGRGMMTRYSQKSPCLGFSSLVEKSTAWLIPPPNSVHLGKQADLGPSGPEDRCTRGPDGVVSLQRLMWRNTGRL